MALFGILKSPSANTGADNELQCIFSTPLTVRNHSITLAGDTISLRRATAEQSGQRWEIDSAFAPTNDSNNYLVHSIVHGYSKTFGVRMPQTPKVSLSAASVELGADAAVGSTTLEVTVDSADILISGEFINVEGDSKVYIVTNPHVADNVISIYPPLRQAAMSGVGIIHGNFVTMMAKFDLDTLIGMTFIDGILMDPGQVRIIEAVVGNYIPGNEGGGEGGGGGNV